MSALRTGAGLLLITLAMAAPAAADVSAPAADLPPGLAARATTEGLGLVDAGGRLLYRLDLDRYRARRKDAAALVAARCADQCARLWRPAPAPAGFRANGDWTAVERPGQPPQLAYKGDPLYTFAGKSLEEAAELDVAPPYFSGYSAKTVRLRDGVPTVTLYWHQVAYRPPAPKLDAPAGVSLVWAKTAYVFADAGKLKLYAPRSGRACGAGCGGLEPLAAPMAARAVGAWRPTELRDGLRVWSYKGRVVYRATAQDDDAPAGWDLLRAD